MIDPSVFNYNQQRTPDGTQPPGQQGTPQVNPNIYNPVGPGGIPSGQQGAPQVNPNIYNPVGPGGANVGAQGAIPEGGWPWERPFQAPAWWSQWNPQEIDQGKWNSWGGADAYPNVKQTWWRDPNWDPHVAYNRYWGWQDWPDVTAQYEQAEGPVSWQDFKKWDLTQQQGPDWTKYGLGGDSGDGGGTGGTGFNWEDFWNNFSPGEGWTDVPGWEDAGTPYSGSFPYPEQWGTAGDVYKNFAYGDPTQVPQEWETASGAMTPMAQTGMPTTQGEWWEAMQPVVQRSIEDQAKESAEQFGLGGLRYSTPLQRNITDIAGREMAQLGAQWTDRELQAQEAARQRQLQASGLLGTLGGGIAGLGESARDRALASAGGLSQLGQQYFNAPMDWSQQMMGMGAGMQGLTQDALARQYQDYMRMTPEQNPWLQLAMGFSGMNTGGQFQQQMYNPSTFAQIMSMFSMIPGLAGML